MSTPPLSVNNIFEGYTPPGGAYDEFLLDTGQPRQHAKNFLDTVVKIGREEFEHRWQQAQRTVQANDFAYSGVVTPKDQPRPWELDAIPFLISSAEWKTISTALRQRAQLLNLVLKDLYGKQTLLKNGVLPAELVYSHPGFLRSYHREQLRNDCFLHFYAADLARSPNGEWWVLADRTEAASGIGFALENRILTSRMFPELFHQCNVERLAPFFIAAQETLRKLAPQSLENPRVVLLSHGPTSPNYFEDAYLARYLGYTLVEGGDLAVRKNQVMLKTLGGLIPVDVIFRRQNSRDCDPLEMKSSNSRLGISGLTQSARSGQVGIANALGSGLIESVAFMAFMPRLSKALLGSELLMPGVASWWCGDQEQLGYVLKNLEKLTIYPAFRIRGKDNPSVESLNQMTPKKLTELIKSNPSGFAAQEKVIRSSVPVWRGQIQPAHLSLRAYAVSSGESYMVMQGALARTSPNLDPLEVSIRKGEGSKDAWILSDQPVEHITLLNEQGRTISLKRSGSELPSRAADNIFWLGRQLERAEALARLLRSAVNRLSGETRSTSDLEVPVLLRCLADQGQIEPGYAIDKMRNQLPPIEHVLPTAVFDKTQSSSLRAIVDELFRLGSIVRDRISLDTWRIIRRIDKGFQPPRYGTTNLSDVLTITDDLITELAAFSGIVMESMTRTQAFRFLELGRRVERSLQIISLVKNSFVPMPEVPSPIFETVLEVADSLMTYRSRYLSNLQLGAVLDLVLTDETNPRSLVFQFMQLAKHVERLPRNRELPGYTSEQRLVMTLLHSVRMLDIQETADTHCLGDYEPLEKLIETWDYQLPKLSEAISHRYLVHAVPSHQLSDIIPQ
ncbi:circularly permuted type 2 ATP-grasp protein [Gimesia maris]|uniref:circularly permuted type 2 ATP-grasp protein n=1 Tax=Gimesia maris TaxID=122 RepID=UPI00241C702D|nr:circularly permuted type 2 ATP-grasp protein [Gimesia maris]